MTSKNDMQKLLSNPVLIYGAGALAQKIVRGLISFKANILGIAVTDSTKNVNTNICEKKIKNIEQWQEYADQSIVLIATRSVYHKDIIDNCLKYGFKDIVPLTDDISDCILNKYFTQWFFEHGISLENETFTVKNGTYLNPFNIVFKKLESRNRLITDYWEEFTDFIIPPLFNDYSMVNEGPYELGEVDLKKGDVVLDLGSNLGLFSVFAVSKGCTVHAFEPTPDLLPMIKHHSELNDNKIYTYQYAVSNECGQAVFHIDSFSYECNSLLNSSSGGSKINVEQITVDEFVKREKLERADFIKADIEGAERLMLEGAQQTLKNFAPKLALCTYHLPDDKEVLTELILKANPEYKIEYKWQKLYAHV